MNRLSSVVVFGFLAATPLHAQIEQLATSGDGRILLFQSRFRLQSETDTGLQGKIYRWQSGEWTRIAIAQDFGFSVIPSDVYGPFLSTDGNAAG